MNHYLFDMNRDWIFATQPETRGRLRAVNEWNPHYFMESHEMEPQGTFLFLPGAKPSTSINPTTCGSGKWSSPRTWPRPSTPRLALLHRRMER
jgi:hypothetical protein